MSLEMACLDVPLILAAWDGVTKFFKKSGLKLVDKVNPYNYFESWAIKLGKKGV
jgi:hypothetical protein